MISWSLLDHVWTNREEFTLHRKTFQRVTTDQFGPRACGHRHPHAATTITQLIAYKQYKCSSPPLAHFDRRIARRGNQLAHAPFRPFRPSIRTETPPTFCILCVATSACCWSPPSRELYRSRPPHAHTRTLSPSHRVRPVELRRRSSPAPPATPTRPVRSGLSTACLPALSTEPLTSVTKRICPQ